MFTKIGDNFGENALENEFPILPLQTCGIFMAIFALPSQSEIYTLSAPHQ